MVLDIIFVAVLHMEALGCGIAVALTICSNATMIVLRMMRARVHGVFRCQARYRSRYLQEYDLVWSATRFSIGCLFDLERADPGVG
ncbi:MAG: hypothetical protein ACLU0O_00980 [Collinsella sp.]